MAAPKRAWAKPLVEQLTVTEASLRLLKAKRVPGPMVEHIERLARFGAD